MVKKFYVNIILFICLANSILFGEVIPLPALLHPDSIISYNDRIYITDVESIYILSTVDFQLLRKFGQKGEGPKEFKLNPAGVSKLVLDFHSDIILVNSLGRVSFYNLTGDYIKEIQIQSGNHFRQFGNGYVGYATANANKRIYVTINFYDTSFHWLKEIYRKKYYVQPNKRFNLVKLGCGNARRAIYRTYNEKLYIEGEEDTIQVFNKLGKEEYVIKLVYQKLKITEKHKKMILKDLQTHFTSPLMQKLIREKGYFPEYFPARIFNIADNRIFIPTYKKQKGKTEFIVLDLRGKLLKRVDIPFADRQMLLPYPYYVRDGRLYQLVDNKDTEVWELHITSGW
jgi:DNA-binding beta-propeller fold protein YncE